MTDSASLCNPRSPLRDFITHSGLCPPISMSNEENDSKEWTNLIKAISQFRSPLPRCVTFPSKDVIFERILKDGEGKEIGKTQSFYLHFPFIWVSTRKWLPNSGWTFMLQIIQFLKIHLEEYPKTCILVDCRCSHVDSQEFLSHPGNIHFNWGSNYYNPR